MILECWGWVVVVDSFVFYGCAHCDAGVASLSVVEDLKVFEDGVGQFDTGAPSVPVEQFDLHATPERFDDGIVETVPIDPIEGTRPDSRARWVNAQDVNWVP